MKLFICSAFLYSDETDVRLYAAQNEEEARRRMAQDIEDYGYYSIWSREVSEVDGYKVQLV